MEVNPEVRTQIYFKRDQAFAKEQNIIAKWQGCERNKELIKAYQHFLFAKGSQQLRVAKLSSQLRNICDRLQKPLDAVTKQDIEQLVAWVNQNTKWTVVTRSDYRRAIKSFYLWFEEEDARLEAADLKQLEETRKLYKYLKKYVTVKYQRRALDYSNIIIDEDAKQLIEKGCNSSMERAIIAVLHETGCRVGELLNLRLRDIEQKEKYAMLRLDGKTGERRVPIIQSLPYLYQWKNDHPFKENENALLWISRNNRYYGQPLAYYGIKRLLTRAFRRAGIKKRNNAHWFRHSRATLLASKYSEQILCKIMGWTIGSAQVRTYVHLGASQVEDAFLNTNGLLDKEKQAPRAQFCVCGTTNTPTARYCYKCGNALQVATMLEDEENKKAAIDEAIMKLLTDPDFKKRFEMIALKGGAQ